MDNWKRLEFVHALNSTHNINTKQESAIFKLDEDCMTHIFSYLSIQERIRIQRVCKRWQLLSKLPWNDKKKLRVNNGIYDHYSDENTVRIHNLDNMLPILKQVLSLCGSSLRDVHIDFFEEESIAIFVLTLLHKYCPRLLMLDMQGIIVTPAVAEYLSRHYNKLEHIVIGRCDPDCEGALFRFFSANTKLRLITLYRSDDLTGSCFQGLPDTIEEIDIQDCESLEVKNMQKSLQRWKNLRSLSIFDNICLLLHIDEFLHALPNKLNLQELVLDTLTFSNSKHMIQRMNSLHHFTNLRLIKLTGNTVLFDQILMKLGKHCMNLKEVYLARSNRVTDFGWQNFMKFLELEVLIVSKLSKISDTFLNYVSNSSLKVLKCESVPVNNKSLLKIMQTSKNFSFLEVYNCKNVDNDVLVSDALNVVNRRRPTKILTLHYGPAGHYDDEEQQMSPTLLVKKVNSLFY